jgi:DNA-binding transcriptional regulator YdaS (Cro superfamily)
MKKSVMEEVFEKAGGRQKLQASLGVSKQTVSDWIRWGHVSAKRAPAIETLTGIPRTRLCPSFDWEGTKTKASA